MSSKRVGRRTVALSAPPSVIAYANIGGKMEGEGPLGDTFDEISEDSFFGEKTWEKAESAMQKKALSRALDRARLKTGDLDFILAGDLLNQCIGSAFSIRDFGIPFFGLYGACSTMGESLALAAMLIDGGFARRAAAMTSSHFCTAERQYRMPVPYGSQRTPTAQWTATAAGCTILDSEGPGPYITHVTCGRIIDQGISDANNMGAAMAVAAYDTLSAGTLVIIGTYRGNPAFVVPTINGEFVTTSIDEDGNLVENTVERPEGEADHNCEAAYLLPTRIQAVLSRTDTATGGDSHTTAETEWIITPGGEDLPYIKLENN